VAERPPSLRPPGRPGDETRLAAAGTRRPGPYGSASDSRRSREPRRPGDEPTRTSSRTRCVSSPPPLLQRGPVNWESQEPAGTRSSPRAIPASRQRAGAVTTPSGLRPVARRRHTFRPASGKSRVVQVGSAGGYLPVWSRYATDCRQGGDRCDGSTMGRPTSSSSWRVRGAMSSPSPRPPWRNRVA